MIVKLKVTSVTGCSGSVGFCPACLTYPFFPQQLRKVVAPNQMLHRKPGEFTMILQNIWIRTTCWYKQINRTNPNERNDSLF